MIEFKCEMCDTEYRVENDKAGMLARCKECGQEMTVPQARQPEAQTPPPSLSADVPADMPVSADATESTNAGDATNPAATTGPVFSDGISSTSSARARPLPSLPMSAIRSWSSFTTPEGRKAARLGRPFDPHAEQGHRKRNTVFLGVALIVGFIMPVFIASPFSTSMQLSFPNIETLGESGIDWQGIFTMLFPLIAGIVVLLVAPLQPRTRGTVLVCLAISQLIVVAISLGQSSIGQLLGRGVNLMVFFYIMLLGSFWGLLSGCRARWYRPNSKGSYITGVIGGICTLVMFFTPYDGTLGIVNVFQLVSIAPATGAFVVLGSLLVIGAAVMAFINTPARRLESIAKTAWLMYVLLVLAFCALMLAAFVGAADAARHAAVILSSAIMMIKMLLWTGGVLLLLPSGLTDLVIGESAIDYSRCLKCNYDLRAADDRMCPECGLQNPI